MVGRTRQLREPEGGRKNLKQIQNATRQRGHANAGMRTSAATQGDKNTRSLSDYQARQRRMTSLKYGPGPTR